jgi:hypothetical protein
MKNPKLVNSYPSDNGIYSDITLRDLFAAAALAGQLSALNNEWCENHRDQVGRLCYDFADALLAARDAGEVEL